MRGRGKFLFSLRAFPALGARSRRDAIAGAGVARPASPGELVLFGFVRPTWGAPDRRTCAAAVCVVWDWSRVDLWTAALIAGADSSSRLWPPRGRHGRAGALDWPMALGLPADPRPSDHRPRRYPPHGQNDLGSVPPPGDTRDGVGLTAGVGSACPILPAPRHSPRAIKIPSVRLILMIEIEGSERTGRHETTLAPWLRAVNSTVCNRIKPSHPGRVAGDTRKRFFLR